MQINPLGRNWGTLVNWDDLGMAISTSTYTPNHTLTRRRKIIRRPHYRLVSCSCRWHPLSNLAPKIAFRPDTQFEDRHHFYCLPTRLSSEDLARIHHEWPLPMQRRVLDHEHLPAFRHCSLPGQRDPITKHRRAARSVASASIFVQWNASTFGSKLVTSGVQLLRTTHSSTEKLLLYCGGHGDTGMLTNVSKLSGTLLQICSSSSLLSSTSHLQHYKATGQAMEIFRIIRARSSAARRWNGSRPHSGNFSGLGSTDLTSCSESETFAMLIDGVCRPSSASSLGMSLCILYLLTFQADLAGFLAHPSGSPPSLPPTSSPSTHGLSLPCGSLLASSSCSSRRSFSRSSKSSNTKHQCTRGQSPSTAPTAPSGPQHPDPKR